MRRLYAKQIVCRAGFGCVRPSQFPSAIGLATRAVRKRHEADQGLKRALPNAVRRPGHKKNGAKSSSGIRKFAFAEQKLLIPSEIFRLRSCYACFCQTVYNYGTKTPEFFRRTTITEPLRFFPPQSRRLRSRNACPRQNSGDYGAKTLTLERKSAISFQNRMEKHAGGRFFPIFARGSPPAGGLAPFSDAGALRAASVAHDCLPEDFRRRFCLLFASAREKCRSLNPQSSTPGPGRCQ
jgi:hypothetical protein